MRSVALYISHLCRRPPPLFLITVFFSHLLPLLLHLIHYRSLGCPRIVFIQRTEGPPSIWPRSGIGRLSIVSSLSREFLELNNCLSPPGKAPLIAYIYREKVILAGGFGLYAPEITLVSCY